MLNNERKPFERFLALLCAGSMLFSMMPVQAFAEGSEKAATVQQPAAVVQEKTEPQTNAAPAVQAGEDTTPPTPTVEVTSVKLNQEKVTIRVNETVTLVATTDPAGEEGNIDWITNNDDVVKVNNGVLTPVAKGSATITASYSKNPAIHDTCVVEVTGEVAKVTVAVDGRIYGDRPKVTVNASVPGKFTFDDGTEVTVTSQSPNAADTLKLCDAGEYNVSYMFEPDDGTRYEPSRGTVNFTVAKKELTISDWELANAVKEYDGNANFAVGSVALDGVIGNDDVSVDVNAFEGVAEDKNVGEKTVTLTQTDTTLLTGAKSGNYTLNLANVAKKTAQITEKSVTVKDVAFADKTYDGTTALDKPTVTLDGVVGSDDVSLSGATYEAEDKNAADGVKVICDWTNAVLAGTGAGNYTLETPTIAPTVDILRKQLTVNAKEGFTVTKTSDGNNTLTKENKDEISKALSLEGVIDGDTVDLVVDCEGAVYKSLSPAISGNEVTVKTTLSGSDAGNYTLADDFQLDAKIAWADAKDVNLSTAENGEVTIADGAVLTFTAGKNTSGETSVYWYNTVPELKQGGELLNEDGTTYTIAANSQGENICEKVYAKVEDTFYGPFNISFMYDNAAPEITVDNVEKLDFSNKSISYTFTVTDAQSRVAPSEIRYFIGDENLDVNAITGWVTPELTQNGNDYTFTVSLSASGYLYLRAADNAGNVKNVYSYRTLVIEDKAPTELKLTCDDAEQYRQTHTVKISASDADTEGSAPYAYSGINRVTYELKQDGNVVKSGEFTNKAPETMAGVKDVRTLEQSLAFDKKDLNGSYVLEVTAVDFCGNSTTETITLNFDNTPVKVSAAMTSAVKQDRDGSYYYRANNGGLTVTFEDDRLADGCTYGVSIVSQTDVNKKLEKTLTPETNATEGTLTFTAEEIADLDDGTVTVTVSATDNAGNVTNEFASVDGAVVSGLTFSFVLDKTAPVLKEVTSTDGNYCSNDDAIYYNSDFTITYTVEELNYDADRVIDASTRTNDGPDMALNATNAQSITLKVSGNADNARYAPAFTMTDKAGNKLADATLGENQGKTTVADGKVTMATTFVLDTTAPQLTAVDTGEPGNAYSEGVYYQGDFDMNFTLSDANLDNRQDGPAGKAVLAVTKDGEPTTEGFTDSRAGDTVMVHVNGVDGTAKAVYGFTLTVADKAGNLLVTAKDNAYSNDAEDSQNYTTVDKNGVATVKNRIMDNISPVVTISWTKLDATHFYKENDKNAAATAYYNRDIEATFAFEDAGGLDENLIQYSRTKEGVAKAYTAFGAGKGANNTAPSSTLIIDKDDGDGLYTYTVYGTDKAGNALQVVENDYYNEGETYAPEETFGTKDATYRTAPKARDTVAPTAVLSYTELNGTHFYREGDDQYNAYYNHDFTATFVFEDSYGSEGKTFGMDESKLHYTRATTDARDQYLGDEKTEKTKTVSYTVSGESDGAHYTFTAYGEDKAGNALNVTEQDTIEPNKSTEYKGVSTDYTSKYHKVLDTVAPVFTLALADPANDLSLSVDENNRAYYNGDITAQFTITDTNLDSQKVNAVAVSRMGTDFNYDTEDVSWREVPVSKKDGGMVETSTVKTLTASADGIYRFEIEGEDRAGNRLVKSEEEKTRTDFRTTLAQNAGQFWTNIKVRDTLAPTLDVELTDGTVFYKARLGEPTQQTNTYYALELNKPYRKANSASGTLTKTDCSPVSVEYTVSSTTNPQNEAGTAYNHDAIALAFSGEQVFTLSKLVIRDRAGNVSTMPRETNKIYLDVTAPVADELAPTVSVVAQESGEGRSVAGRDLFNSNVTVRATVTDPGENVRSSGLYQVYYQVLVNGEDWTSQVAVSGKGSVKSAGVIGYGTSGQDYESAGAVDEPITSQDVIDFGFDANTFNYNDVKIYVWAEDNSGNVLQKSEAVHYFFGIDITDPTIEVRYDNNDAQNEKYFKEDRTATITVTERNFDPNSTKITTESNAISSWTYQPGSMANGDDDKWICTVAYTEDGDYTFDVTTTDLVGHRAAGADYGDSVAPREFTVDKTSPIIHITFDNNDVRNGKYYNAERTATVSIEEHNFSTEGVELTTTANIQEGSVAAPTAGGWSSAGDNNTASVSFTQDGNYTMKVEFTDLAGNEAEPQDVDEFVVDTTAPELEITGVEDMMAYNGDVAPVITYHDINYDDSSAGIVIVGVKNPEGENLTGTRTEDAFGGSFTCDNIEAVKENDDIYTATGSVSDLAGNTTEVKVTFSVNRFGSTYMFADDTQALLDKYYTNTPQALHVIEINVDGQTMNRITTSRNGEVTTLKENSDYTVQESVPGWHQFDYTINAANFDTEGAYDVTLYSADEAGNASSNRSIKENDAATSDMPITFVVDKTPPVNIVTGVDNDEQYVTAERTIVVNYDDNVGMNSLTLSVNGEVVAQYDAQALQQAGGSVQYQAKAANHWQELKVVSVDVAGNASDETTVRYLLTGNLLVQYYNNKPIFYGSLIVLAAVVIFIVLLFKRKKEREEEKTK